MDNVCNRRLFTFPCKVEMAEEQEYLVILSCVVTDVIIGPPRHDHLMNVLTINNLKVGKITFFWPKYFPQSLQFLASD